MPNCHTTHNIICVSILGLVDKGLRRGTDLYAHRARSGNVYFYLHHWSLWQRESSWLELVDRHEALDFLLEKARLTNVAAMDEDEIEKAKEFGFNILEETA